MNNSPNNKGQYLKEWREKQKEQGITPSPKIHRSPIEKMIDNPNSRSMAIDAMCWSCMGCERGWRALVRNCSSISCPLYPFRIGATEEDKVKWQEKAKEFYKHTEEEGE